MVAEPKVEAVVPEPEAIAEPEPEPAAMSAEPEPAWPSSQTRSPEPEAEPSPSAESANRDSLRAYSANASKQVTCRGARDGRRRTPARGEADPEVEVDGRAGRARAVYPDPPTRPQASEPAEDLGAELESLEEQMAAETTELLTGVLDRLGAAHHRPFSRG